MKNSLLHVPLLRRGRPYRSLDIVRTPHYRTGEPFVEISQANGGLIRRGLLDPATARGLVSGLTCQASGRESGLTEALIEKLGYLGIALLLVLGGLGLPVPEEAPSLLAAVLSKSEKMWPPFALGTRTGGVRTGDLHA